MLTHVDKKNQPKMVDVIAKKRTCREAIAESLVILPDEVFKHFSGNEIQTKKGPVFQTAIIAATMAAKKTCDLIPFCHPLAVEGCDVKIIMQKNKTVRIRCTVRVEAKTGVEMEALVAVSIAALTIYDMCKALSQEIQIGSTRLISKSGGKSDYNVPR